MVSGVERERPWAVLGLVPLAVVAMGAWLWLDEKHEPRGARAELATLSPWPDASASCPAAMTAPQLQALEQEALAGFQRGRFDWREAPRAVRKLEVALHCARRAGDLGSVDRLAATHRVLRGEVQRRFDAEALRLELALRSGSAEDIERRAGRVEALLAAADSAAGKRVSVWLRGVRLRARAAGRQAKALEDGE